MNIDTGSAALGNETANISAQPQKAPQNAGDSSFLKELETTNASVENTHMIAADEDGNLPVSSILDILPQQNVILQNGQNPQNIQNVQNGQNIHNPQNPQNIQNVQNSQNSILTDKQISDLIVEKTQVIENFVKSNSLTNALENNPQIVTNVIDNTQNLINLNGNKHSNTEPLIELNKSVEYTDYKYGTSQIEILSKNIETLTTTGSMILGQKVDVETLKSMPVKVDYKSIKMSDEDAVFFADLVQKTDSPTTQSIAAQIQSTLDSAVKETQKPAQISATLMNAISEAAKNNQPIRIDFDKDISVIIRVDRNGSVMANFIPGDKAAEQYLKDNMAFLRQRFDEQDIPYSDLSHSNSRQQQEENRRNKQKENSHE